MITKRILLVIIRISIELNINKNILLCGIFQNQNYKIECPNLTTIVLENLTQLYFPTNLCRFELWFTLGIMMSNKDFNLKCRFCHLMFQVRLFLTMIFNILCLCLNMKIHYYVCKVTKVIMSPLFSSRYTLFTITPP